MKSNGGAGEQEPKDDKTDDGIIAPSDFSDKVVGGQPVVIVCIGYRLRQDRRRRPYAIFVLHVLCFMSLLCSGRRRDLGAIVDAQVQVSFLQTRLVDLAFGDGVDGEGVRVAIADIL